MRKSLAVRGAASPAQSDEAAIATRFRSPAKRRVAVAVALAGCVVVAVLCRLPFLGVPLTQDEGGYAYVARLWAAGAHLYSQAWVDRPQGLMLLFRFLAFVAPGITAMRLAAGIYAAASALLLAYVGWRLYGVLAGMGAAALYAVFSSTPQIEGFTVNGELLATLPTVMAVALILKARGTARADGWLLLAGVCAGAALLIKQSAIDGLIVVMSAAVGCAAERSLRRRRVVLVGLGVVIPLSLSALHGALTGWTAYLDAVLLDNLRYRDVEASAQPLAHLIAGVKYLWAGDAALVVAALLGVIAALRGRGSPPWLAVIWLAAAALGMSLGGLFSRHYFVQLVPPLCLLAAAGVVWVLRQARVARGAVLGGGVLGGAVLAASVALTASADAPYYVNSSPLAVSHRLYNWPEYNDQDDLVTVLRAKVPAAAPLFVAFAAPELHYLTGRPSVTPYLWRRPLGELPGAYEAVLRAVDSDRDGPVCIVIVQDVTRTPGDERMRRAILSHYHRVWTRPGLAVYCRTHAS